MKSLQLLVILMATRSSVEEILRLECQTHADFSISLQGLADVGSILTTHAVTGLRECVLHCISLPNCKAVNYKKDGGNCELVGRQLTKFLVSKTGWTFVTTDHKEIRVGAFHPMINRLTKSPLTEAVLENASLGSYLLLLETKKCLKRISVHILGWVCLQETVTM